MYMQYGLTAVEQCDVCFRKTYRASMTTRPKIGPSRLIITSSMLSMLLKMYLTDRSTTVMSLSYVASIISVTRT